MLMYLRTKTLKICALSSHMDAFKIFFDAQTLYSYKSPLRSPKTESFWRWEDMRLRSHVLMLNGFHVISMRKRSYSSAAILFCKSVIFINLKENGLHLS